MKNLFERVYIKHDNNFTPGVGQRRIIVTDREMKHPFSEDQIALDRIFVKHNVKTLDELETFYGGRDGLWSALTLSEEKILIIASPAVTAELLIQYWKSIFKNPTKEFLKLMYDMFIAQENLLGCREKERNISLSDSNVVGRKCEPVSDRVFELLFNSVKPSQAIQIVPQKQLPIEYLLMAYLSKSASGSLITEFYRRMTGIVLVNIVRTIVNSKEDLFSETHNYYLLDGTVDFSQHALDPVSFISNHRRLSWALDEEFVYGNEDNILKKYSTNKLKDMFRVYEELFRFKYDEETALDFIIARDYKGLIEFDISDEKGNFFGTENYLNKINGFLVSHLYKLARNNNQEELSRFELKQ